VKSHFKHKLINLKKIPPLNKSNFKMSTGTTKVLQDADGVVYGSSDAIHTNAGPEPIKIQPGEDEPVINEEEAKKDRNIYKSINASDGGRGGNLVGSVKQSLGKILKNKKLEVCFSTITLHFGLFFTSFMMYQRSILTFKLI